MKYLRHPYTIVILALGLFMVACLDEVDLVPPDGRPQSILIQGKLLRGKETSQVEVTIERLFNFEGFNSIVPVVTQTEVYLHNTQGQTVRIPVFDQGIYRLNLDNSDANFLIEANQAYRLEVRTVEGVTYLSNPSQMLLVPNIDTLNYGLVPFSDEQRNIVFKGAIPLNIEGSNDETRFRWRLFESFKVTEQRFGDEQPGRLCYISRNLEKDNIFLFDASISNADFLDSINLYEGALDERFAEGYYLTVILESLDEEAHTYWDQTKQVVEREGSMFDPAPGVIQSNFRNVDDENERVFGFFYASMEEIQRVYVDPATVEFPDRFCPPSAPPSPFVNVDSTLCGNCLWALGSSLEKPDYWEY